MNLVFRSGKRKEGRLQKKEDYEFYINFQRINVVRGKYIVKIVSLEKNNNYKDKSFRIKL